MNKDIDNDDSGAMQKQLLAMGYQLMPVSF